MTLQVLEPATSPHAAVSGQQLEDQVLGRTFWLLSGAVTGTLLGYTAWSAWIGVYVFTAMCLIVVVVNAACMVYWRLRPGASVRVPLHVTITTLYVFIGLAAFIQSGTQAPALRWLFIVPVLALMAGLSRLGIVLFAALLMQIAWMLTAPAQDWPALRQQLLPAPERQLLSSSIGAVLVVALMGWQTTRWRRDAYRALDAARALAIDGEARKEQFLATMSHEIRTPLNGIVGVSSMLKNPAIDGAERLRLTRLMDQSARALLDTLNNVLDWTKMNHGPMQLNREPFALAEVVEDAINLFAPMCQAKGVALLSKTEPDVPARVTGDRLRLQQMLNNLLSNAVKFTNQGRVLIRLRRDAQRNGEDGSPLWLQLTVEDSGIGIPQDKLAELFQPFHQLDATIARRFGGTGLGLSIVQGLARAMGGDVAASSRDGQGTCFTLHLPFEPAPARIAARAEPSASPQPTRQPGRTKILVAEDSELNQWILQEMLEHCEAEAHFVSNGIEALQALDEKAFDLLLIDQHMPGLDGLSTVARIREQEAAQGLPRLTIVLISGDNKLGEEAARQGVDASLLKPFEFAALKNALARLRPEEAVPA